MHRRAFLFSTFAWGFTAISARAQAAWPVHTARFVVPFAAGSAIDVPTRMIADRLAPELGANFIIENHSGAGGAIGAQFVVEATPDGGTFLVTSSSIASLPALRPGLGFDPQHDLLPVSLICDVPSALLVRADSPLTSVPQLIAEARAKPRHLSYGSGGVGSSNHLAGASFATLSGVELLHVPYRGTSAVLNGLYGGDIDLMFAPTLEVLGLVKQGALRALGVTMPERVAAMPDVPAIAEFVPGYVVSNWFAIFAPAKLSLDLRARLVKALVSMRDWPEFQAHLAAGGAIARLDGPEPLAKQLAEDTTRWAALINKLGIKAE